MLPWDEWGRMKQSYQGKTGPDYDELLDKVAAVCAADDTSEIVDLYSLDDVRAPAGSPATTIPPLCRSAL